MKVRGVNYNVEIYNGNQGKERLILLHGFTGSTKNWMHVLDHFSQFELILIDLIGHGQTESPKDVLRYSMEEVVNDIKEIMDMLEISHTNMLGYSMGGRVALSFTVRFPQYINKLVLESSSPGLNNEEDRIQRIEADTKLAKDIMSSDDLSHFVRRWEDIPLFKSQKRLPDLVQSRIRHQRLRNSPLGLANSLMGMGTGVQPSLWHELKRIKTPVLLLCGELDQKFCEIAKQMMQQLENSSKKEIIDVGHAIHVEQPQIFGKIVNEFLLRNKILNRRNYIGN
ncbi:2-succinyl-6-hydroxy-2,4-cyclohexadiene-1-carboxylate synthase [Bacillus weihaiensis]|uniref:2-succinyl-6-hydroxy-2, 4-cyclohexadiene-1-carboxylate synthase n=1 Tax=Bacillus weihaiensis TaxID=1547283 RepID=UPI0023566DCD|nr:2-succinyl-6-hydroxy-2,4-cyclohexadiene-1-carboxylate synthase [Bacillus weihaiensis]